MTCPRCGADGIPDGAPGCPKCGQTLGDEQARTNNAAVQDAIPEELEEALRRELSKEYQITDLLGRGGMSLVYLAQEVDLNRQVAIKVLPLQFLQGPASAERFEREAKIAASLDHPHIVPIFRVGATSTFLWYTMKRIRGRSFEQIIMERGALPLPEVLGVVEQVGSALQYTHRHGVVHRDIKPANLHLGDDGRWRVLDLGVALSGRESAAQRELHAGTPSYINPEQWDGAPADAGSDLYALGVTLYRWLTGRLPYGEIEPYQAARYRRDPVAPSRIRPDVPIWLDHLVRKAVARDPRLRFETAEELLLALERGASRPVSAPAATPLIHRDPAALWKIGLAISLLLNALLLFWLLFLPR